MNTYDETINHYIDLKSNLLKCRQLKYHNFFINYCFNGSFKLDIPKLKLILKYFINNAKLRQDVILINILELPNEKKIHNNWKHFLSGFKNASL